MFDINYIELFKSLPAEITVMLIAFIPIAELRASIPIALGFYKMSITEAIFWSVVADIIITAIIIYSIEPIYNHLAGKFKIIDRFFNWLFRRTRTRFFRKYEIFGNLALMIFVAIPLPITGAWTGSIASWLFDIPKHKALFYISLGVIISAVIVTLISLSVLSVF